MATNNSKSLHYPTDLRSVGISERVTPADLKPPSTTLMIFKLSLKLKIAEVKSETTKGQPKKKTSTICRIIWRVTRRGRTSHRKMIKRVRNSAKKVNIPLKMAQYTVDSGLDASDMDLESKLGQMEPATRVSGRTIRHTAAECFTTWMATCLTVNGATIRHMALAPTSM